MIKNCDLKPKVVVIGAGYAGISAAEALQTAGLDVIVLEKEDRVGGRACSLPSPGCPAFNQDLGAQFVLSSYHRLLQLMDKAHLRGELIELGNKTATLRAGKLRVITADPMSIYWSGLLGSTDTTPRATLSNPLSYLVPPWGLAWGLMEKAARTYLAPETRAGRQILQAYELARSQVRHLPPDNYAAWTKFDNETAANWLDRHYGREGTSYLAQPLMDGLFFQQPEDFSKAILFWMTGNLDRGDKWHIMKNGTQSIPQAIAKSMKDLRLSTDVTYVEQAKDGSVVIETNRGNLRADAVIIAVPPPLSKKFLNRPNPLQAELMSNGYAATIVVNLRTTNHWRQNRATAGVHMVLNPQAERMTDSCVAAFSLESGKGKTIGNQELIGAHLTSRAARTMMNWSNDQITAKVIAELDTLLPGLASSKPEAIVKRWENAIPHCGAGSADLCQRLWAEQKQGETAIYFAGDGTSFPTMEGAAWSGYEAAKILIAKFTARLPSNRDARP